MDGREGVAGCRSPQKVKSLQRACHTCSFSSRVASCTRRRKKNGVAQALIKLFGKNVYNGRLIQI